MKRSIKWTIIGVGAVLTLAAGAGIAVASGVADSDAPITGTALGKASAAALAHTGGGRVTGTEVGDEESYYEVEVTLESGGQVDVQLDRSFHVVGSSADHEDRGGDNDAD